MPHTILLFEDDPTIRALVSELLAEEGYGVLHAGSLREAEGMLGRGGVGLVLADSGEATGEAALAAYRRFCGSIGGRAPTIVFTAHRLTEEETRGLGCAAVLPKPFDIDRLLGLIGEQLAR